MKTIATQQAAETARDLSDRASINGSTELFFAFIIGLYIVSRFRK